MRIRLSGGWDCRVCGIQFAGVGGSLFSYYLLLRQVPSRGEVEFVNYSTKYRPDLDLVVKDISFKVSSGEMVMLEWQNLLFNFEETFFGDPQVEVYAKQSVVQHDS